MLLWSAPSAFRRRLLILYSFIVLYIPFFYSLPLFRHRHQKNPGRLAIDDRKEELTELLLYDKRGKGVWMDLMILTSFWEGKMGERGHEAGGRPCCWCRIFVWWKSWRFWNEKTLIWVLSVSCVSYFIIYLYPRFLLFWYFSGLTNNGALSWAARFHKVFSCLEQLSSECEMSINVMGIIVLKTAFAIWK